jgi:hypothetical protein
LIRLLTSIALIAAANPTAHAEECVTIQATTLIKKQVMGLPGVTPEMIKMMSPDVRKMIEEQSKPAKPESETQYWTPSMVVTAGPMTTTIVNMDTMTTTTLDHKTKTYHEFKMGDALKQMKFGKRPKAKDAEIKIKMNAPTPTGKKKTIAGLECTEYQMRIDNNGGEYVDKKMAGKTKHRMPKTKIYNLETRCVSVSQPAAFFRIRKSHEEKFMQKLDAETRENLRALMESEKGSPTSASMFTGLITFEGGALGSDFYRGLELQTEAGMKTEIESSGDPKMDAAMQKSAKQIETGRSRLVKSVAMTCPPAAATKIPADYKPAQRPKPPKGS